MKTIQEALNYKLIEAIFLDKIDLVEMLLDAGADANAKTEHGTPALFLSATEGKCEILKLFISRGADLNATNKRGETALECLIEEFGFIGPAMNKQSERDWIVWQEARQLASELLLSAGADVDVKDGSGLSLEDKAEMSGKQLIQAYRQRKALSAGVQPRVNNTTSSKGSQM